MQSSCRRAKIIWNCYHRYHRQSHQFRSLAIGTVQNPIYYRPLIRTLHSFQSRRTDISPMAVLDDTADHGSDQVGIDQSASTANLPRTESHYFYRWAAIDLEAIQTDDIQENIRPALDELQRLQYTTRERTESVIGQLQRLLTGRTHQELLQLLPAVNLLPNRWNSTTSDHRELRHIALFINDLVAKELSIDQLKNATNDQRITILNTCTNFANPSTPRSRIITSHLIRILGENCFTLSDQHLVHLLFAIGLHRIMPASIALRLENELIKRYSRLTIQQLLVGAFAFYRTDTEFDGRRILDVIVQQHSSLFKVDAGGYGLCMIAKLLKLNSQFEQNSSIPELARDLIGKPVSTYSLYYWSHFASACREMRYYHPELAEKMLAKMITELDRLRLKDVVLILNYLTLVNHPMKDSVLATIVEYLRRTWIGDWKQLPVRALHALSLKDIYPLDLISNILDPDYLSEFPSRRKAMERLPARAWFWLDCSVAIERPDYVGHRLDVSLFERSDIAALLDDAILIQPLGSSISNLHMAHVSVAAHMIQLALGCDDQCIFQGLILPHSPLPGILVKFKNGKPVHVHVDQSIRNIKHNDVKVPNGQQWIAVLLQNECSCKWQSTQFVGNHLAYQRQLEKLGYKVLIVHHQSLPKKPTTAGVKRFDHVFRSVTEKPSISRFHY